MFVRPIAPDCRYCLRTQETLPLFWWYNYVMTISMIAICDYSRILLYLSFRCDLVRQFNRLRFVRDVASFVSCEIVALWENSVDRLESYDSFNAKSCAFLEQGLGYISAFPCTTSPKARYHKKFLRHLPSTLVPSITLQSLISLCHVTRH